MIFNFLRKVFSAKTINLTVTNTKMVFIVRTDLNMKCGKIAAQCAHGAVSLYASALKTSDVPLTRWLLQGQPKIVLKSDNEDTLVKIYKTAKTKGLNACLIYDAGKTQVQPRTLTLVGIGPSSAQDVDLLTKSFKLL